MTIQECYIKLGGNFEEVSKRLINEKMVTHFTLRFPSDKTMKLLLEAVEAGDIEASFRNIHTLKGVAATLSYTELYNVSYELTEQLRPRTRTADPVLLDKVVREYNRTIGIIKEFESEMDT